MSETFTLSATASQGFRFDPAARVATLEWGGENRWEVAFEDTCSVSLAKRRRKVQSGLSERRHATESWVVGLVLCDGSWLDLVRYDDEMEARTQAQGLADLLEVPLLDNPKDRAEFAYQRDLSIPAPRSKHPRRREGADAVRWSWPARESGQSMIALFVASVLAPTGVVALAYFALQGGFEGVALGAIALLLGLITLVIWSTLAYQLFGRNEVAFLGEQLEASRRIGRTTSRRAWAAADIRGASLRIPIDGLFELELWTDQSVMPIVQFNSDSPSMSIFRARSLATQILELVRKPSLR